MKVFIEHEGSLYRGFARSFPTEVWSPRQLKFVPYRGVVPKPVEWGDEVTAGFAAELIEELSVS